MLSFHVKLFEVLNCHNFKKAIIWHPNSIHILKRFNSKLLSLDKCLGMKIFGISISKIHSLSACFLKPHNFFLCQNTLKFYQQLSILNKKKVLEQFGVIFRAPKSSYYPFFVIMNRSKSCTIPFLNALIEKRELQRERNVRELILKQKPQEINMKIPYR